MSEQTTAQPGDIIRAKWVMDGAQNLLQASQKLQVYAAYLKDLHQQGWTLAKPVEDDYGFLVDPQGNSTHPDDNDDDEYDSYEN